MKDNMYDERGLLKPQYTLTSAEEKAMFINNDIDKIKLRNDLGYGSKHDSMNDVEKAYFDFITSKFSISDKDITEEILAEQQEKVAAYIKEKYGSYLLELLEQYGYIRQDNNRVPKR